MKKINVLLASAVLLSLNSLSLLAAATDADDFADDASAKGIAEVEAGKLALQKATSPDVKAFAQQMITDHKAANAELASVAKRKNLKVADDAELMDKAKAFMLKQRDGESFDAAYTANQVTAHEQTIELFQKGAKSDDADIAAFANATLPKLESHLKQARILAKSAANTKSDVNR
jgi:putative membrane protein